MASVECIAKPYFSVVVPVYNKEEFVERSIASILCQDFQNFEIVVVVDKSTDNSLEIVKRYTDPRIKVFTRETPGPGGYAARNLAIHNSKGQWISFLDADDVWYSDHLSCVYHEIQYQKEDLDMVVMGYESDTGKKCSISTGNICYSRMNMLDLFARRDFIHTNCVVIRKELFVSSCLFPDGRARQGGDADTWLRVILRGNKFKISNKITSFYYSLQGGVVSNKSNLGKSHPIHTTVSALIKKEDGDCDGEMKMSLMRISNRKNISWLLHKKKAQLLRISDLSFLYIRALVTKDFFKLGLLLVPRKLLSRFIG